MMWSNFGYYKNPRDPVFPLDYCVFFFGIGNTCTNVRPKVFKVGEIVLKTELIKLSYVSATRVYILYKRKGFFPNIGQVLKTST